MTDYSYAEPDLDAFDDDKDNGVSLITADNYIKYRLVPTIHKLNNETVPWLQRWHERTHAVLLLSTLAASTMALVGWRVWIPVVVSFIAATESLSQFQQTAVKLEGANNALAELKNLRIWWQSLAVTDHLDPVNKKYLIEAAEAAMELEWVAWTRGMLRKKAKQSSENGAEQQNSAANSGAPGGGAPGGTPGGALARTASDGK